MGRRGPKFRSMRKAEVFSDPTAPITITEVVPYPPFRGPSQGDVTIPPQYMTAQTVRQRQRECAGDAARETVYRLQGVQLIDAVRAALHLPVRTFATACTYYHRVRLAHVTSEYNFSDAALAALAVACKVEDTLKKPRDILCASHNLKNPEHPKTPDDKAFDEPVRVLVGLDRVVLQTVGFDFRARHPHRLLVKLARQLVPAADARTLYETAYSVMMDLYKTFVPAKQTSFTMAHAALELAARLLNMHLDKVAIPADAAAKPTSADPADPADPPVVAPIPTARHTSRACVIETLLDLLELYTTHGKTTLAGGRFDLDKFIAIKIDIHREQDDAEPGSSARLPSADWCQQCDDEANASANAVPPLPMHTGPRSLADALPANAGVSGFGAPKRPLSSSGDGDSKSNRGSDGGPDKDAAASSNDTTGPPSKRRRTDNTMRFIIDVEEKLHEDAIVASFRREEYDDEVTEYDEPVPEPAPSDPPPEAPRGPRDHSFGHGHRGNHTNHGYGHQNSHSHNGHGHNGSHRGRGAHGGGRGEPRRERGHLGTHGSHRGGAANAGGSHDNGWPGYPRNRNKVKGRKGGGAGGERGGRGDGSGNGNGSSNGTTNSNSSYY